jgi:hypothetical protein
MAAEALDTMVSGVSDTLDLPLDGDVVIDDAEYQRIMRRITIQGGGTDTTVSAFNSAL